jgi:hypothetical protein
VGQLPQKVGRSKSVLLDGTGLTGACHAPLHAGIS